MAPPPAPAAPSDWAWNLLVVATYLPVALGALGFIGLTQGPDELLRRLVGEAIPRDLALGLAPAVAIIAASRWITPRWERARRMERALARTLGPLSWKTCVILALASSVGEELLFRGVLQPWMGLIPASLLFAVVHVPVDRDLALWPTFALGAGLVLGGLYAATGALLAPIVCHFTINVVNLRHLARLVDQDDLEDGFFQ